MVRGALSLALFIVVYCALPTVACTAELSQDVAVQQGIDFVELLDRGDLEACWQEMTPLFKAITSKELWQRQQSAFREAFGPLMSRKFARIDFRDRYARTPDGNFVIVQMHSTFQHKSRAVETIVLDCLDQTECLVREYQIN